MKKVTKAEALKAMASILYAMRDDLDAEDFITVVRFIEQQWEPDEQAETVQMNGEKLFEVTAKSEGTI